MIKIHLFKMLRCRFKSFNTFIPQYNRSQMFKNIFITDSKMTTAEAETN